MEEIGRNIIRLESVDSTNNYTANRARANDLRHGSVILAVDQTGGRGQMGTAWTSEAGKNLTFSVFLEGVNVSVERQFILTKIVSLSLVNLLKQYGLKARIKWPNDIYVNDQKIAGVLIENFLQGSYIHRSIVGVGLNVNQDDFGVLQATSLKLERGVFFPLDDVLFSYVARFNEELKRMHSDEIHAAYLNDLYWLEEKRTFRDASGEFEGTIKGVEPNGQLIIEQNGEMKSYTLKEVQFMH